MSPGKEQGAASAALAEGQCHLSCDMIKEPRCDQGDTIAKQRERRGCVRLVLFQKDLSSCQGLACVTVTVFGVF